MDGIFPDSMFERIGNFPWFTPTPEDMKKEAEEMARPRKVVFEKFYSEIYDLSDNVTRDKYIKDFTDVLTGIKTKTHLLFNREKQFVATPAPKWVIFMEWAVFKLIEDTTPELPPAGGTPDIKEIKKERKLPDGYEDLS